MRAQNPKVLSNRRGRVAFNVLVDGDTASRRRLIGRPIA